VTSNSTHPRKKPWVTCSLTRLYSSAKDHTRGLPIQKARSRLAMNGRHTHGLDRLSLLASQWLIHSSMLTSAPVHSPATTFDSHVPSGRAVSRFSAQFCNVISVHSPTLDPPMACLRRPCTPPSHIRGSKGRRRPAIFANAGHHQHPRYRLSLSFS
jgi:hypothetical protein